MGRKWILLVCALLMLGPYPRNALSLGLGDIVLHSALNEPLDADIPIVSARPDELQNLDVNVASEAAFRRTGAGRTLFLSRLRFEVLERRGAPYIHATSTQPVREPFLDLVIEASWPKGRLERRYTVLLDPRGSERQPPISLPVAAVEGRPAPVRAPVAARRPSRRSEAAAAPAGPSETYGPVASTDTLWSIAQRFRPDPSVSMQQMMLAILRANPGAFIRGNINLLKAGVRLRIPGASASRATSAAEAAGEVREQTTSWRSAAAPALAAAPAKPTQPSASEAPGKSRDMQLRVVTPPAAESQTQPGTGQKAVAGPVQERLALANEEVASSKAEAARLSGRVQQLEGMVASMQRLLTLKSEELAKLQAKLAEAPQVQPELEAKPQPPSQPEVSEESQPQSQPEALEESQPQSAPSPEKETVEVARPPAPTPQPKPVRAEAPVQPSIEEAPVGTVGVLTAAWDKWRRDPVFLASLAAAVLILGSLALVAVRGRRAAMATRRMPRSRAAAAEAPVVMPEDPLTSAERMIAAGRHADAAELLQAAMDREPARQDLKLKLLDVHHAAGNRDKFVALARQVLPAVAAGAALRRVKAMGQELAPEEGVFKDEEEFREGAKPEAVGAETPLGELAESPRDQEGSPYDWDLDHLWSLAEQPAAQPAGEPAGPAEGEAAAGVEDTLPSMEWDFKEPAEATGAQGLPELKFDFGEPEEVKLEGPAEPAWEAPQSAVPTADEAPVEPAESAPADQLSAFQWDLADRGEQPAEPTTAEFEIAPPETGETVLPSIEDEESALSEASAKAMSNRLDLAKAYIDLGDTEDARALLEEVRREGNDAVRQEAEALLARLS
jgi:pilus assembly protein FimV